MYPYVTQTYWNYVKKINGKSRAFRESGTLLVVKKIPILDFSRVPKKRLVVRRTQHIYLCVT